MSIKFVGRQKEIKILARHIEKKISTLVVIKGRRRIGKSRLVEEFAKKYTFLGFSGLAPIDGVTDEAQKNAFLGQVSQQINIAALKLTDWSDIFHYLNQNLPAEPCVVLFDEISWMGSQDATFLPKLKNAWDLFFSL